MIRYAAMAAASLCTISCVRTVQSPQPVATYGVQQTMARQVRNATDAGDGDYRIRTLRERVVAMPDDLQARMELASLYREAGFPDVAVEHYRIAAAKHPQSAEVAVQLARTLRSMRMPAQAMKALEPFTQTAAEAASWMGILLDESAEYAKAEPNHRNAVAAAPESDTFHNNLGYNLLLQKRDAEAAAEFRRALEINPKSQTARNNLGLAAPDQALTTWMSAGDAATAHSNLAAALIEKADYAGARREIELALGYRKDHSAALRNLQLLTELDGGIAQAPRERKQPETGWEKFSHAVRVIMVGKPEGEK
jgi:protein O-GlcNAc transferase